MATFTRFDELQGSEFIDSDLRGARFVRADLSGVVMRAVDVQGADIDAPWLLDGEGVLRVNGVDVVPFVEAELNRRFPGRADRRVADPDGLRAAWATLERAWVGVLERVAGMPPGTVDECGTWSWPRTHGCAGRFWRSNSPSIPSANRTPSMSRMAATCRSSRPLDRRMQTCSKSERIASPWCAPSLPPSHRRTCLRRARTPGTRGTRRPPFPAFT
jgi:hypothetical protein